MSAREIQGLAQEFADAFSNKDVEAVLGMLSEDVEIFDHVPYRFDDKAQFGAYLAGAVSAFASMSFSFRQPSCRVLDEATGIVNNVRLIHGGDPRRQGTDAPRANDARVLQAKRPVEDRERALLSPSARMKVVVSPKDPAMSIANPLADSASTDEGDRILVARARSGDRAGLEELVRRHQGWIYNIAVRMLHNPHDAEDATQEILLKAVTRLSSFEDRSSFRTWLYRIVVNHVLNMKRGRIEREGLPFQSFADDLDATPDSDLPERSSGSPDARLLVAEAMMPCTSGILVCLDCQKPLTHI